MIQPNLDTRWAVITKENCGWYYRDGRPCLEVPLKKPVKEADGSTRTTTEPTLRHARKLGLLKGTTSLFGILNNVPINNWKIEKALAYGKAHPGLSFEDLEREFARHLDVTSERGTYMHGQLEKGLRGGFVSEDKACRKAIETLLARAGAAGASYDMLESCMADPGLGIGGKIDATLTNGWIEDFKTVTKARGPNEKEIWQVSAYMLMRKRAGFPVAGGRLVYLSQETGELLNIHEIEPEEYQKTERLIPRLVDVFATITGYDPRLWQPQGDTNAPNPCRDMDCTGIVAGASV